ncbi:unnamed protein product [Polarella glacialis]|uniref:DNA-directed RNA polymerase I subunit RPA12 n=1 Tax=Polarella glacialis TaxID=89957 RepID=A0A813HNT4_POLGL|nr:unnamed protein product [Polarella glacialis]CAE8640129.1 unnamed protein product [Polarella glacialis]CAE8648708.1 unnamed protein product [Polarella glacialis]|mmetsp:Transcript_44947/g.72972  ORF Transcript_44947/g.72972 Transcript_44947/m.72972 type:complete len:197 (+) Transcript_44947:84-674(+)|eukprot:CAMPEP_0115098530 /NCGR_PEP_ID=MMETSP0227-20121206/31229_1 /TAXON_ID=89957 /ORGANISM="Polarella glacialis, Strain CCMP 1383" /LENGTH=196 /DNA_ID=CAMNT_0002493183 /DNA_START=75 /DNA_END=665 /DNA_ORIENTATION=-
MSAGMQKEAGGRKSGGSKAKASDASAPSRQGEAPARKIRSQTAAILHEDFEAQAADERPEGEEFAVRKMLGVWRPENYLCSCCGQVFDYGKISGPELNCTSCGFQQPFDGKAPLRSSALVIERVTPPWWSHSAAEVEAQWKEELENKVTEHPEIQQECPGCGNERLQFWTRQLRSADEGLSVFYLCKKCGWRTVEK